MRLIEKMTKFGNYDRATNPFSLFAPNIPATNKPFMQLKLAICADVVEP